jgi:hypothetical protein
VVRSATPDGQSARPSLLLREVLGLRAWLVHLLFVDDPHGPTSAEAWSAAIGDADRELGLLGPVPAAGHVLLSAGKRAELTEG